MNIRRAPLGSLLKDKGKATGKKTEPPDDKFEPKAKTKKPRLR